MPLTIPVPLEKGNPGQGYPWHWSIYQWLEGENATLNRLTNPQQTALDLAHFIAALQQIDSTGGPSHKTDGASRGEPLAERDKTTRQAIASLKDSFNAEALTAVWDSALNAPVWPGPPVWIHGDLQSGNLLVVQGRLSAVIDFGCLGVGDPASDIMTAWLYLPAETRHIFRATLQVDEATWTRARGWALSMGVIALPYYQESNPILAGIAKRAIEETLADFGKGYCSGDYQAGLVNGLDH